MMRAAANTGISRTSIRAACLFVASLDIFSGFLVDEQKCLPAAWRDELHYVGRQIENRRTQLQPSQP